MEYIRSGLERFSADYQSLGITSIAFPKLGTAHGGLDWNDVFAVMRKYLEPLNNLKVEIYHFSPNAEDRLFRNLRNMALKLPRETVAERIGITNKQAVSILEILNNPGSKNMCEFHDIDGLGKDKVTKIYGFAMKQLAGQASPEEEQLELFA